MKRILNLIKESARKVGNIRGHSRSIFEKTKSMVGRKKQFAKPKQFKHLMVTIIVLFGMLNFVFGISVYVAKSEDSVTKFFAGVLQLPAIFTSSGTISVEEFLHNKNYVLHFYKATDQGELDEKVLLEQIREQLVENKIIENAADKYKISLTKEEKDTAIQNIIDENGGADEVEKVLEELYGLSLKQFKKLVYSQLLREKINNELIQRAKVSHILIRSAEDASEEQLAETKAKIDNIRTEIMSGKSFSDVAKEHSEDVGSNELGGSLDPFSRGEMVQEFEDVAFSTPIGEITDPIRTSFGWHILLIDERTGEIENNFDSWLTEMREETLILNLY